MQSVSGTVSQITVTGGTGEGSAPVISIASNPTLPGNVIVGSDLQVNNNLNVTGNITVGGTTGYILVENFRVSDADIILGFTTDSYGNDVSNDTTANHGGIAVASTEGNPLVNLTISGIETLPATYKKIMWFKAGTFSGLGTDAWLSNYAVGIGSTQFPTGTRLAAGNVQFTQNDLAVVRNINASGIITANFYKGDGSQLTGISASQVGAISGITIRDEGSISGTAGIVTSLNFVGGNIIATAAGAAATITISDNLTGTSLNISGLSTLTTLTGTNLNFSGIGTVGSLNIDAIQVISSARQLQNIASLDATTTATIEAAIANAPNTFTDLNVTGISTLGVTSATNLTAQQLNVSGLSTFSNNINIASGIITTTGSSGVGIGSYLRLKPYLGEGGEVAFDYINGNVGYILDVNAGNAFRFANYDTTGVFTFLTNSTERLRITNAGLIGIGSASPIVTLDVIGAIKAGTATTYTTIGGDSGRSIEIGVGSTTLSTYIDFQGSVTYTDYATRLIRTSGDNSDFNIINRGTGALRLVTQDAGSIDFVTNNTFRHRINSDGVVLVGTATSTGTASQLLQVNSGGYFSGSVGIGTTNPGTNALLHISKVSGFNILQQDSGSVGNYFYADSAGLGFVGTRTNHPFIIGTNNTERVRIDSNGNLGINTINPTSKLYVVGDGYFTGVVTAISFSGNASSSTFASTAGIASALTSTASVNTTGIITASQFSTGSGTLGFTTNTISGPSEIIIDPSPVGVGTTSGIVRILGDLYVDGTQFVVNSTTIELADFNVGIASTVGTNALLDGAGIGIGSANIRKTFTYNNTANTLESSIGLGVTSGGSFKTGTSTVLTSTTLGSSVVNSSLTSVGTLGQLNVSGITTVDQLYTSNNGNGQNVRIGDDLWIGDINVANTTRLSGNQNADRAFIVFGNSDSVALGRTGTGPLYYGGNFVVAGIITTTNLNVSSITTSSTYDTVSTRTGSATLTTTSTAQTAIHSGLSTSSYRSVEYMVQGTQGTNYHSTKILVVHDGVTAYLTEYGTVYNVATVASYDVDISGGNLRLLATPSSASSTTFKVSFTSIVV